MATAVQAWNSGNFFPPQNSDPMAVSSVPAVAYRLWGLNAELTAGSTSPVLQLDAHNSDHLLMAAETIARGGIIAAGCDNNYIFLADGDNEDALHQLQQPSASGREHDVKLVCALEWLSEHVDFDNLPKTYRFANILRLSRELTSSGKNVLGLVLPAGERSGAAPHLVTSGKLTTLWTEYRPIRDLFTFVRYFGRRSLMAVSASVAGLTDIHDLDYACQKLKGRVALVLRDSENHFAHSQATVIDFTRAQPELRSSGNMSVTQIQEHLSNLRLGEMTLAKTS